MPLYPAATAITSLTGDVTGTGPGAAATTIGNNKVTNSMLAQMATQTIKGRTTAGTGNAEDLTAAQVRAIVGVAPTQQRFTSGTAQTYTTPSSPAPLYLRVRMVGPGGGGAGSGTAAAGAGGNGSAATTFGTALLSAGAGQGGAANAGGNGGNGGAASVSAPAYGTAIAGGDGGPFDGGALTLNLCGANGASSYFGGAGRGGLPNSAGGNAQANSGSGGGGGGNNNTLNSITGTQGGAGGYVEAIIPSPSATYSYTVGLKGAGGTAGTNGFAGGDGADGYIEVTEYYQ